MAHDAQPTQSSGFAVSAYEYPEAFTFTDKVSTSFGQAATHKEQPLHLPVSTTTAPFILLISAASNHKPVCTSKKYLIKDYNNPYICNREWI